MARRRPLNVDLFRRRIDQGGAGDKIAYSDPALAPLGTDDEAAGTPPTQQQMNMAATQLVRPPRTHWETNPVAIIAYVCAVTFVAGLILAVVIFS